ncbi:MAG: hypothetical protein HOM11_13640 [Methylococcales bacterium]|jgi:hypothetical protein|nr:hypothetical protein [Methylococcales bacterium]MBT7442633.1 hypothetical protein [Methylococcales bacterium]
MENDIIQLEGANTPDIILNKDEVVLMDVSQGFRDLGLAGLLLKHKGRLITTNQRAIYFKKKTKDFEIEQMNMHHVGYVRMGYNLNMRQFVSGLTFLAAGIASFAQVFLLGLVLVIIGVAIMYTSRIQGLILSGSGEKIAFATKTIPAEELSKIITIVSANS